MILFDLVQLNNIIITFILTVNNGKYFKQIKL